jgi:nitrogen fixation protein NifB
LKRSFAMESSELRPNLKNHPCFDPVARHTSARIHLPVAPRCNVQCLYCNRQFDCLHESRPGVTSTILTPREALEYLKRMVEKIPQTSVVGIAGPGDPMANPDETLATLRLVRETYPEMLLCLASNGLSLLPYLDDLAVLDVSHVTVTVNAVDPEIASQLYAWMRYGKRTYSGLEGATYLLERQKAAVIGLKERGIIVKINSILIPGYNDSHLHLVAKTVAEWGADLFNLIPLYPVEGTPFGTLLEPSAQTISQIRTQCAAHLPQMSHCQRCRADAAGLLGHDNEEITATLQSVKDQSRLQLPWSTISSINMNVDCTTGDCSVSCAATNACGVNMEGFRTQKTKNISTVPIVRALSPEPMSTPVRAAVGSLEGVLVNLHLGQAQQFHVYEHQDVGWKYLETRPTPDPGNGDERWQALAHTFSDCQAIFVSGAGDKPIKVLKEKGVIVWTVEGLIEELLEAWSNGSKLDVHLKSESHACGEGCRGGGNGCG